MNEKKTILITAPYFPPEGGGLERYALQVARLLNRDYGWRVVVISSNENKKRDYKERFGGVEVYRLASDLRFSNTPLGFRWPEKILGIIEEEKPDVINIHTPVPGLGDMTSLVGGKIPQVVTYHTGSMCKGNYLDILIVSYEKLILTLMLRRAKSIICSSEFVRKDFLKEYMRKSETITPGVDAELFKPNPDSREQNPTVLFVAKLDNGQEHKGLTTLLDSIIILKDKFPKIRLEIAGDGNLKKKYEDYAWLNGLNENVRFLGKLESAELVKAYQSAQVFALPTSNDSHPLVILEAMSAGLPVVSTKIGGIPAMIENGKEGFLVEPHNPSMLAEKIGFLLENPKLREKFSEAARLRVIKDFSWQVRAEKYNSILEKALQ